MARNAELIRQWEILRSIDGARNGISAARLAAERGVCQRTIKRDLEALCRAGFPLRDEKINGTTLWKLCGRPFGRLEDTGLGVMDRKRSSSSSSRVRRRSSANGSGTDRNQQKSAATEASSSR